MAPQLKNSLTNRHCFQGVKVIGEPRITYKDFSDPSREDECKGLNYQADMKALVHSNGQHSLFDMPSKIFGPKYNFHSVKLNLTGAVSMGNFSASFVVKSLLLLQFKSDKKYQLTTKGYKKPSIRGKFQQVNGIFVYRRHFYNTYPSLFNFHIRSFDSYGNDNLHFGQPVFRSREGLYDSYDFNNWDNLVAYPTMSNDGTFVRGLTTFFPQLINSCSKRVEYTEESVLEIKFPIKVMKAGSCSLKTEAESTDQKLKLGVMSFNTEATIATYSTVSTVSTEMRSLTDLTNPGKVAIFEITFLVGASSGVKLELEGGGDANASPIGASVINLGLALPISSDLLLAGHWSSNEVRGSNLVMKFPAVYNADSEVTRVVIGVYFQVKETACTNCSATVSIAVTGGQTYSALKIPISKPKKNTPPRIGVHSVKIGWEDDFIRHFPTGKGVQFSLAEGLSSLGGELRVFPGPYRADLTINLVLLDIKRIGANLPCIQGSKKEATYLKSSDNRIMNDSAFIELDGTCPVKRTTKKHDDEFLLRIIYNLPSQELSGSYSNINIRGGFLIPAKQISVFSYDLPKPQESLSSDSKKVDETISQYVDYNKTLPAVMFDDKFATKTPITVGGITAARLVYKIPPGSRGIYNFWISAGSSLYASGLALCHVRVSRIGANFLGLKKPEGYQDEFPSSEIDYRKSQYKKYIKGLFDVSIRARVTSWRDNPDKMLLPAVFDMTADDEAVEIIAFTRILSAPTERTYYRLEGTLSKEGVSGFSFQHQYYYPKVVNDTDVDQDAYDLQPKFIPVFTGDTLQDFHAFVPKLVGLLLTYPVGLKKNITVTIINKNFDEGKHIDFCSLIITRKGNNIPCLNDEAISQLSNKTVDMFVDESGKTYHRSVSVVLDVGGQYPYSDQVEDRQALVEFTFLSNENTASSVTLEAEITVHQKSGEVTTSLEQQFFKSEIPENLVSPDAPILKESSSSSHAYPGEKIWLPIEIVIPRGKLIPLSVALLTPSVCGQAHITVSGVRFGESGDNICCGNSQVNLEHLYDTKVMKTDNVTTFMQTDLAIVNFTFIQNGGYTFRRGLNKYEDDILKLEFEIQVSDVNVVTSNLEIQVGVATKTEISLTSRMFSVRRHNSQTDRIDKERPNIVLIMKAFNEETAFMNGDKIWASGSLFHLPNSRGEAPPNNKPTYIRFIFPPWIEYDLKTDVCKTNYTVADPPPGFCVDSCCLSATSSPTTTTIAPSGPLSGSYRPSHDNPYSSNSTFLHDCDMKVAPNNPLAVELHLPGGVLFQDYIGIYFSLTVDPKLKIRVGAGILKSVIASVVYCDPVLWHNWPSQYPEQCGVYEGFLIHGKASKLSYLMNIHFIYSSSTVM